MLRMDALSPKSRIKLRKLAYSASRERLESLMKKRLDASKSKLLIYLEKYKALSPVERIGHGFAAVTGKDGKRVTDIGTVNVGDELTLTMREGQIKAMATQIRKRENDDA